MDGDRLHAYTAAANVAARRVVVERELTDLINRTIAEGQQIIEQYEHSDPARCAAVKVILFLMEEALQGDTKAIKLARGLTRRKAR